MDNMTKTGHLQEIIAQLLRDDAYEGLGLQDYNKGWQTKEDHEAYLKTSAQILQACQKAGLVFATDELVVPPGGHWTYCKEIEI